MSILKLNVMRAPEMASIFGIWGLLELTNFMEHKLWRIKRIIMATINDFVLNRNKYTDFDYGYRVRHRRINESFYRKCPLEIHPIVMANLR